ncbi:MAG: hypothetical protein BWY15_00827 [Firmicutes bacterium ADurb.Bin193]|nr:MAG: hypothetical protein BWY15_00827 [Firmicutes bacterium ADurb.Bin193]
MEKRVARKGFIARLIADCLVVLTAISCIQVLPYSPILMASADSEPIKPRLLVTSDIGGDPDDKQSMVRLMCYSNEFDLEGYVCTALKKDKGEGIQPHPEYANEIITAYGQVRDNLLLHKSGYPTETYLKSIVKTGANLRDLFGNANQDTEGSTWIIACADKEDSRPLNIAVWGGASELVQAIWKVKTTRTPDEYKKFISKLRVFIISRQDTGLAWLNDNVPELFLVCSYREEATPINTEQATRGIYLPEGVEEEIVNG